GSYLDPERVVIPSSRATPVSHYRFPGFPGFRRSGGFFPFLLLFFGVVSDGTTTRTHRATGEALLVPTRKGGSWVSRITGNTGKSADDGRVTDGPVVARRRGNARGAKGPCCS